MNVRTETRTIDEIEFRCTQFTAMTAFELLGRLLKTVGPALGALTKFAPDTQLESIGSELMDAFSSLDPKAAAALVPDVLAGTSVVTSDVTGTKMIPLNSRANIDMVFSGRGLKLMFKVLGFALGANYADFSVGSAPSAPGPTTTAP